MLKKALLLTFLLSNFCFGFQQNEVKTDSVTYYLNQKKSIKALAYTHAQSELLLKQKKYNEYCDMMEKRCQLFRDLNDSENALKVAFEELEVSETHHLLDKQAYTYTTIGNIHTRNFNFSKAREYLNKSKKIALKLNNNKILFRNYQGFYLYHATSESDSTLYYLKKVDEVTKNSDDYIQKSKNANNFAMYYLQKNNYKLTKEYAVKAIEYAKSANNIKQINASKNNYGVCLLSGTKEYHKAIVLYKDIIANTPEGTDIISKSNSYLNLSYAYEMLGDYKTAMFYNNKYFEIQDIIISEKLQQASQEIETKYEVGKIEDEYKLKTQKLLDKQKFNQNLLYLFGALLIVTGILFYIYYQNLKLKQKNKLKDLDTNLQYKIISATIDGQEQERNKISEVLHDNISATLSSVGLHLSAFESQLSSEQIKDLKKTRSLLKQAHDKVRDLSHELVPPLLVKFGLLFALKDLCENNSNSLITFTFNSELPKNIKFNHEFETKIFYIISELFNNAIKHSKANKVDLTLKENNGKLLITVTDNGKGFSLKEAQLGFGLTQIKARINNMNGKISFNSQENKETVITIEVEKI